MRVGERSRIREDVGEGGSSRALGEGGVRVRRVLVPRLARVARRVVQARHAHPDRPRDAQEEAEARVRDDADVVRDALGEGVSGEARGKRRGDKRGALGVADRSRGRGPRQRRGVLRREPRDSAEERRRREPRDGGARVERVRRARNVRRRHPGPRRARRQEQIRVPPTLRRAERAKETSQRRELPPAGTTALDSRRTHRRTPASLERPPPERARGTQTVRRIQAQARQRVVCEVRRVRSRVVGGGFGGGARAGRVVIVPSPLSPKRRRVAASPPLPLPPPLLPVRRRGLLLVRAASFVAAGARSGDCRQLFQRGVAHQRRAEPRGDASARAHDDVAEDDEGFASERRRVGGEFAEDVPEEGLHAQRRSDQRGVPRVREKRERESNEDVPRGELEGVRAAPRGGGLFGVRRVRRWFRFSRGVRERRERGEGEVDGAEGLPREGSGSRGDGAEERQGAVVPDADAAREVGVHRAHAPGEDRAGQAVELEVHEPARLRGVRGEASERVREEAQEGDAHRGGVVQVMRVPQRERVRETGGDLEVRLRREGEREKAREGGGRGGGGVRRVRGGESGGGGANNGGGTNERAGAAVGEAEGGCEPAPREPGPRGRRGAPGGSQRARKPPRSGHPPPRSGARRSRAAPPRDPPARRPRTPPSPPRRKVPRPRPPPPAEIT